MWKGSLCVLREVREEQYRRGWKREGEEARGGKVGRDGSGNGKSWRALEAGGEGWKKEQCWILLHIHKVHALAIGS
jgi:hypothetical protein